MKRVFAVAWLSLFAMASDAFAWGEKGHSMTARVAARKLPSDMPAFFRGAEVELGYLCPEPDRWRNAGREPTLRGAADRDHVFKLEDMTAPLPVHRYDFFLQYVGKPKPGAPGGAKFSYTDIGFAPYAIAERGEMLATNFMLWRHAAQETKIEKRIKRQIEQNIIHIAGLFAHFVTDIAMPLHTSIHGNGWNPRAPNPKGYAGNGVHGRFESDYVGQAIEEKDFEGKVKPLAPRNGLWLDEALKHVRTSYEYVEPLYVLDAATPFGSGKESAEAKTFTCERLAYASQALRDFWYAAWTKSALLPQGR